MRQFEKYLRKTVEHAPFCPGCGNGILMGAILRAIDELEVDFDKMVFVSGIGCSAWIPSPHFNADTLHTLHGRAVAFATGVKVARADLKVVVISGDGDLASIGGNHLIHAARRGIELTVICSNNFVYGMTGGQVASTTPVGGFSATTPPPSGNPYRPFDLVSLVLSAGAEYAARYPVTMPVKLKDCIKKALECRGFSFVEAVTPCPTQFGRRNRMDDIISLYKYIEERCVSIEKAKRMDSSGEYIIVGEFENR